MAHENNPDYMQLPLFRIVVDGMYYCGELVSNAYTFNDPFSSNSFHTAPGGKTTLEFSEIHEKAKLIEGRNNLASHVKRVIEFVTCASDMPKEIKSPNPLVDKAPLLDISGLIKQTLPELPKLYKLMLPF